MRAAVLTVAAVLALATPAWAQDDYQPVVGGGSFNAAPILEPGRYRDTLLPSEYLKRQVYGMFWFEREAVRSVIDQLADNLMFETDFPHATSLSPGPASESPSPREVIHRALGDLPDEIVGKVLQHTATRLYSLDPPVRD